MPTPLAPTYEIGYAQAPSSYWWMYQDDETTPELQWPKSISVYDTMRRTDSQVTSVLRAMTLPVRRTTWRVDPNGARDEVVRFVADDLGLPIVGKNPSAPPRTKDRFSWADHLRLALLMLPFGHMYFEFVYRVDDGGGRAHLRKLGPRMPKTIERIEVASDGGLISITQYPYVGGATSSKIPARPIPVNRLVAYIHEKEGGNWLGQSILRPAYKNWLLKDRLLRVQAQTIERNGMGVPRYTDAEGATPEQHAMGLAMAKAWRSGEAAGTAIPFGAMLDLVGVSGTLPDAEPAVRYHDEQIGRAVLAHFLNLGTQTGSWALGTTFADFFTMSLQTLAEQVADTATQHVVEDLVDVNWGPEEPAPKIVFDEIGSRQAATAAAIKSLVDAGILEPDEVLESSTRQQYGLPPKDPDTTRGQDQGGFAGALAGGQGTGQPFYAPPDTGSGSEVYASADIDDYDDDEPGQFDEMTAVLAAALSEFIGEVRAAGLADWDPAKHPRDRAGRFRTVFARVMHALEQWARGEGGDHPLKGQGFTTANLRTVATKHLGLKVRRSTQNNPVTPEELEDLILEHVRAHVRVVRDRKADEPKRQAKFTLQSGELRDKDVAVYRMPGDKPALFHESESGKRGGLVERFDDLRGLEKWADEHGETRLAEWARKEAGGKAPTKAVPSATKAAPAKRVPPAPGFADDLAEEFYRNPNYTKQDIRDRLDGLTVAELKKVATATNVEKPRDFHKTEAGAVVTTLKTLTADEWREHIAAKIVGDRTQLGSSPAKAPTPTKRTPSKAAPKATQSEQERIDWAKWRDSQEGAQADARKLAAEKRAAEAKGMTLDEWRKSRGAAKKATPRKATTAPKRDAPAPDLTGANGLSTDPAVREVQVENRIRAAYAKLRPEGGFVNIADVRDELGDLSPDDVDAALRNMTRGDSPAVRDSGWRFIPIANAKVLTDRERAAALHHGGENLNAISLRDPSPRPLPGGRAAAPDVTGANLPDASDPRIRLDAATTREEAHAALDGLSGAQLKQLAKDTGTYIGDASTKDAMKTRIVEHTVGFRLNSATLRGGTWADSGDPEALRDALDLRTVDQLKAMLRERGLPVSGRKRELVDRLVDGGGVGPKGEAPRKASALADRTVGRDISGETNFDSLPTEYNAATNHDDALREILRSQGFDGRPQVVSQAEFDAAVKRGEVRETWRGLSGSAFSDLTPEQMAEAFRTGDLQHVGTGINGNGTYVAIRRADGEYYGPTLLRIGLRRDAKVIAADDLDAEMDAYFAQNPGSRQHRGFEQQLLADLAKARSARARANIRRQYRADVYGPDRRYRALAIQRDPGRFAALRGYDAIMIPKERSPDKHAEMIILNRTATIVQEAQ